MIETFVTVSDAGFFVGTVALLNSLRLTGNAGRIVVVDRGLTDRQRALLEPHASVLATGVDLAAIDPWLLKPVSAALVTDGIVLLVDSDMIVTASLSKAVEAARAGKIFAYPDHWTAVQRRFAEWEQLLGLERPVRSGQTYVNAGFVAFSRDAWPHLLDRLAELCRRIPPETVRQGARDLPLWAGDQDALNALLMSEIPQAALEIGDVDEEVSDDAMGKAVVDSRSLRCTYRDKPVSILHHSMTPKPWRPEAWRRTRRDDAYVRLLPRLLFATDLPLRLAPRDVPLWLRGDVRAHAMLAGISVLREASAPFRRLRRPRNPL